MTCFSSVWDTTARAWGVEIDGVGLVTLRVVEEVRPNGRRALRFEAVAEGPSRLLLPRRRFAAAYRVDDPFVPDLPEAGLRGALPTITVPLVRAPGPRDQAFAQGAAGARHARAAGVRRAGVRRGPPT